MKKTILKKCVKLRGKRKDTFLPLRKDFIESQAFRELTLNTLLVLSALYFCLKHQEKNKRQSKWETLNNGDISIAHKTLKENLDIVSNGTITTAIHTLVRVGVIKITHYGGIRVGHKYKILYNVVKKKEERWRNYPEKNWEHECPKHPSKSAGRNTQIQNLRKRGKLKVKGFKSTPNQIGKENTD